MKTAVSLPDETFERAERAAKALGMSRSELYARAVDSYVAAVERSTITEQLNAAIDRSGQDERTTAEVTAIGRALLESSHEEPW